MSTIVLNCWILGKDHKRIFDVEIDATKTVMALKKAIKAKKTNAFQYFDADDLDLWKVSIPFDDHFDQNLNNINVEDNEPLPALLTLSSQFADQPRVNDLHIVIGVPPGSESRQFLQLNCLVLKEEANRIFRVEIEAVKTVGDLKKRIKEEKKPAADHIPADFLDLWKVSLKVDDNFQGNVGEPSERPLLPVKELLEVFPEKPPPMHVHIVVKVPPIQNIGTLRAQFLQQSFPTAKAFSERQTIADKILYCDWAPDISATIPLSLLHPIFGQFIDDCNNCKPTPKDNAFVLTLLRVMSDIYPNEDERAEVVLNAFENYGLSFVRVKSEESNYLTDGGINHRNSRFALIEMKNEVVSRGAEPFIQSIHYYLESTRRQAPGTPSLVLPCIIISVFGPYMSIAGAAWELRPVVQVLAAAMPFYFPISDTELNAMAARYICALKNAIHSLQDYYLINNLPVMNEPIIPSNSHQIFPYQTHFTSLVDSTKQHFEYVTRHKDHRLLFFGKLSDGCDICIKFTRRYSQEVHSFCASKDFAPKLLGCELIPGGWWMVVMNRIDERHVGLRESPRRSLVLENLKSFLTCLHQNGFVHGDIRDTNIMVPRGDESYCLLVDFDWAGRIGSARYPMNVRHGQGKDLWRPEGAVDGKFILAEHDDQMLEHLFSLYDTGA